MAQEKIQNGPEPAGAAGGDPQTDTAGKSLADALRLSFRLLTLILIFVLAALPFSRQLGSGTAWAMPTSSSALTGNMRPRMPGPKHLGSQPVARSSARVTGLCNRIAVTAGLR